MAKKRKKTSHEKHHKITIVQPSQETKLDKVLVENFVSLQRVLTNLAVNLDNLSNKISKLLDLFEISAKALAEKDFEVQEDNKYLVEKLDNLIGQNKILAKGMALMHERMPREQFPVPIPTMPPPQQIPQPIQSPPQMQQMMPQRQGYNYTQEIPPSQSFQQTQVPKPPKPSFSNFESPIE